MRITEAIAGSVMQELLHFSFARMSMTVRLKHA